MILLVTALIGLMFGLPLGVVCPNWRDIKFFMAKKSEAFKKLEADRDAWMRQIDELEDETYKMRWKIKHLDDALHSIIKMKTNKKVVEIAKKARKEIITNGLDMRY